MKTIDFSLIILTYNFIIGLLLMTSSEKIGVYAGYFMGSYQEKITRLTRLGIFTFGSCAAALSAGIYLVFHLSKL